MGKEAKQTNYVCLNLFAFGPTQIEPPAFIQLKSIWNKRNFLFTYLYTVKPVYNSHPWDPKIEAVVDRWSLFRGSLYYTVCNWDHKIEAVVARWPLFRGGR